MEQAEELRKALEKERDLKHAEAIKEFNKVKLQVESKLRDLELREGKVEAIVSKVASFFFSSACYSLTLVAVNFSASYSLFF